MVAVPGLRLLFGGEGVLAQLVDVAGDSRVGEVVVEGGFLEELADAVELGVVGAEEVGFGGGQEGAADLPGAAEGVEFVDDGDWVDC